MTGAGERPRAAALAAALLATRRPARRAAVLATVGAGSVPVLVAALEERVPSIAGLTVLVLAGGAAIGWATDEPATDVLTATPLGPLRLLGRCSWAAGVVVLTTLAVAALGATRGTGWLGVEERLPETAASAGVALATGVGIARRRGEAAVAAVVAGLLAPVVSAGLATRWPRYLPMLGSMPADARWWWLAGAAGAAAILQGRTRS